ncbi:dynein assembly factor 3, axonemal-like [Branchiostoma floridae]|uniref:Dynein axonemal assembly factor 3 n=1 Tax=Branchiostoma floridae TaxID=7739 RepID=A0A9J7HSU3_BRAFL|nr:dynein assembly factor 3, axonemal-like [Branchiostoma floridae]
MASKGTEGFGNIACWGFSPAQDLQDLGKELRLEKLTLSESAEPSRDLNVLLVGAGDCRHILKTIAQSYRWNRRKINFYVVENQLELLLRHLLLLNIALEPPDRMGLQEKTELYLEVFGDALVREQTADYIRSKATDFIKLITDADRLARDMPLIDMSMLKFRERDAMEAICKFWRDTEDKSFDIVKFWDARQRRYLEVRYDSRKNVYDWDRTMKLHEKDAKILHGSEYNRWRDSGVAFQVREGDYTVGNRTLASGVLIKREGERIPARGYWGDIATGPFISHGIESENQDLFKTANGLHTGCCSFVSEYNLLAMFHEILHRERYVPPKEQKDAEGKKGATLTEITEEEEEAEDEGTEQTTDTSGGGDRGDGTTKDEDQALIPCPDFKVHFLPLNACSDIPRRSKYAELFDVVFFATGMVHGITPELNTTLADEAVIIVETAKYLIDLRKEQLEQFGSKVNEMAAAAGWKPISTCDFTKDVFAKYQFKRES